MTGSNRKLGLALALTTFVAPALAYVDSPAPAARVAPTFEVRGWAFKEGVGLSRVEVTIDGVVVAEADYGSAFDVGGHFPGSLDPNQPQVGFTLVLVRAMTMKAVVGENRPDIAVVFDLLRQRHIRGDTDRRERQHHQHGKGHTHGESHRSHPRKP